MHAQEAGEVTRSFFIMTLDWGRGGVLPWFAAVRMCSVFFSCCVGCVSVPVSFRHASLTLTLGWQSADQPM